MDFWRSLAGTMEVALTSAEPEEALWIISTQGIIISRVQQIGPLTFSFRILRKDLAKLKTLCNKRGETLQVKRRIGIFWAGRTFVRRPVLLFGLTGLLLCGMYVPSRVFFVKVEGNSAVPKNRILEAVEETGLAFGTSRREVRSERVKNGLLAAVPELEWVGVNTSGCVATVSVRERLQEDEEAEKTEVSSIVAARDGYILSGTVTRGNCLFQVGQTVKKGEVLVSGYTDCGIYIQACQSEGEILGQTSRALSVITPAQCTLRETEEGRRQKISLLLGKNRINLWKDSGNYTPGCGRMYEEYYVTLPGGFRLPLALCMETVTQWETTCFDRSLAEAKAALTEFSERYLNAQMIAGQIQNRAETIFPVDGGYRLEGEYVCTEMIGRVRREQIGDIHGKIS